MTASKDKQIKMPMLVIYFKVLRKVLPSIMIYFLIFMSIAVLLTKFNTSPASNFEQTKANVAFINYDGDTPLVTGLKNSLSGNAVFVNVKDDKQSLQDALFFRSVDYIIKIPKGFTQEFLNGGSVQIDKTGVPASSAGVYMDYVVNRYLNTTQLFYKSLPGLSQDQLAQQVKNNLSVKAAVTLHTYGSKAGSLEFISSFFKYLAYILISILFLSVSAVMNTFDTANLRNRTMVSPLRPASMNMQLFLGHGVLLLAVWIISILLGLLMCGTGVLGPNFVLLCINLFCFALAILSLSFFLGRLVHSPSAQNGIANVLSLGMCFISGIFIPQSMLSGSVLAVARFTPSYWYVKAANDIQNLVVLSQGNLQPVFISMLIELGFAAAFLSLSIAFSKRKNNLG
jgi:ABC-2 type transport system permease protein